MHAVNRCCTVAAGAVLACATQQPTQPRCAAVTCTAWHASSCSRGHIANNKPDNTCREREADAGGLDAQDGAAHAGLLLKVLHQLAALGRIRAAVDADEAHLLPATARFANVSALNLSRRLLSGSLSNSMSKLLHVPHVWDHQLRR